MSRYDPDLRDLDLADIRYIAREYFDGVVPSHDWHHVKRVNRLAYRIAGKEPAHRKTVQIATLLHDIGRPREDRGEIDDHADWGASETGRILSKRGVATSAVKRVQHCVRSHRYSTGPDPQTPEARVLSDADNLDALGAIGIARVFSVCGERDRVLAEPDLPPEEDPSKAGKTGLNHLVKKILSLPDRMYTSTGQRIARDRHRFTVDFVDQLRSETRVER